MCGVYQSGIWALLWLHGTALLRNDFFSRSGGCERWSRGGGGGAAAAGYSAADDAVLVHNRLDNYPVGGRHGRLAHGRRHVSHKFGMQLLKRHGWTVPALLMQHICSDDSTERALAPKRVGECVQQDSAFWIVIGRREDAEVLEPEPLLHRIMLRVHF